MQFLEGNAEVSTITTKPGKLFPDRNDPDNEEAINQIIDKGGGVTTTPEKENSKTPQKTTIRLPKSVLEQIDAAASRRPFRIPRNQWILEAVLEKLDREKASE